MTYQLPAMRAVAITSSGERKDVDVAVVQFATLSLQITLQLPLKEQEVRKIVCFDIYAIGDDGLEFVAARYEKGYPFADLYDGSTLTLGYRLG
jgi:hypothetical protein